MNPQPSIYNFAKSVLPTGGPFSAIEAPLYVESGHEAYLSSKISERSQIPIVVIGAAGTGKSTLVDYVLRSYIPDRHPEFAKRTIVSWIDAREFSEYAGEASLLLVLKSEITRSCEERGINVNAGQAKNLRDWFYHALSILQQAQIQLIVSIDKVDRLPTESAQRVLQLGFHLSQIAGVGKVILSMHPHSFERMRATMFPALAISVLNITGVEPVLELYSDPKPPAALVTVVHEINTEIIRELQKNPKLVHDLAPRRFEELIAEMLASFGWDVQLTPETKDGGYDIFAMSKDISGMRTSWIIECKRYRDDRKVGVEVARSLYAVKGDLRVANAMIATTSSFTKGVLDYKTSRYDFHLRDYEGLIEWINDYRPNPNGKLYLHENKLMLPKSG